MNLFLHPALFKSVGADGERGLVGVGEGELLEKAKGYQGKGGGRGAYKTPDKPASPKLTVKTGTIKPPSNVAGPGMAEPKAGGAADPSPSAPAAKNPACPYGGGKECISHGGNGAATHAPDSESAKAHAAFKAKGPEEKEDSPEAETPGEQAATDKATAETASRNEEANKDPLHQKKNDQQAFTNGEHGRTDDPMEMYQQAAAAEKAGDSKQAEALRQQAQASIESPGDHQFMSERLKNAGMHKEAQAHEKAHKEGLKAAVGEKAKAANDKFQNTPDPVLEAKRQAGQEKLYERKMADHEAKQAKVDKERADAQRSKKEKFESQAAKHQEAKDRADADVKAATKKIEEAKAAHSEASEKLKEVKGQKPSLKKDKSNKIQNKIKAKKKEIAEHRLNAPTSEKVDRAKDALEAHSAKEPKISAGAAAKVKWTDKKNALAAQVKTAQKAHKLDKQEHKAKLNKMQREAHDLSGAHDEAKAAEAAEHQEALKDWEKETAKAEKAKKKEEERISAIEGARKQAKEAGAEASQKVREKQGEAKAAEKEDNQKAKEEQAAAKAEEKKMKDEERARIKADREKKRQENAAKKKAKQDEGDKDLARETVQKDDEEKARKEQHDRSGPSYMKQAINAGKKLGQVVTAPGATVQSAGSGASALTYAGQGITQAGHSMLDSVRSRKARR